MPFVIVERLFEQSVSPAETVKYPAGWTGMMASKAAKALLKSGCGRIDFERQEQRAATPTLAPGTDGAGAGEPPVGEGDPSDASDPADHGEGEGEAQGD